MAAATLHHVAGLDAPFARSACTIYDGVFTKRERNEAKLRYHKNQLKALEHEESELNRKARNHRIFTRGGMLESFLLRPLLLTDEQVHSVLKVAFHPKEVGDLIKRFIDENERKLDEEEQDEKTREN